MMEEKYNGFHLIQTIIEGFNGLFKDQHSLQIIQIAWIISDPRLVPIQDASIEDVCAIPRNRCGAVLALRSGRLTLGEVKEADFRLLKHDRDKISPSR